VASRGAIFDVLENLTQPDTIVFTGLPADTILYHINLSQGFIINGTEEHQTHGSGEILVNQPGHSVVAVRGVGGEQLQCRIIDVSGKIVYVKSLECSAGTMQIKISTGKNPVYLLSVTGASFAKTFKLTGGSDTDVFDIEATPFSLNLKSSLLDPLAGGFTYSPGDKIRFKTFKSGYYSNLSTRSVNGGDTVIVWMSEPCPGIPVVTDVDGNTYHTVQIGDQCWMRENIKAKHYADGTPLVDGTGVVSWMGDQTKYWFDYDDNPAISEIYGRLYTQFAVTNGIVGDADDRIQGICPNGWHVSSDVDFNILESFLGMTDYAELMWRGTYQGEWLKEAGDEHWDNAWGSNRSGFTALAGGVKIPDDSSSPYDGLNWKAVFWTSTTLYGWGKFRMLVEMEDRVLSEFDFTETGLSCRCVQNSAKEH
jgi:uncharacterized protein (TIGR02145 family)